MKKKKWYWRQTFIKGTNIPNGRQKVYFKGGGCRAG
jgi:hypothetical protein